MGLSVNPTQTDWGEADGMLSASTGLLPQDSLEASPIDLLPEGVDLLTIDLPLDLPVPSVAIAQVIHQATPAPFWFTDDILFHHQRCRRRSYLDTYGDTTRRDPPNDYLLKIRQDSVEHRKRIFSEAPAARPNYPKKDWITGAAETLKLMEQGCDRIANGVLMAELGKAWAGSKLVSSPDLLIKQPGSSRFGDWTYVSVDIRVGKRPKQDYQIVAAYHAYLLAMTQAVWAETSWLTLKQRGDYAVSLVEMVPRMQLVLQDCLETVLNQAQEPEVFIAHSRCDLCPWSSHCYNIAEAETHLSLLPGVTPSRYIHLKHLGLTTLDSLATAPPKALESLPGFGPHVAHRLVQQAQSTLENRAIAYHHALVELPDHLFTPEELPTAPIELYFDIEAAPEHNLVYLHGVLVVDRQAQTEVFHPLLAENLAEEAMIWQQLLALLWRYPHAPIFHFCPYEVQTVKRLAELYGTPEEWITPLLPRFVDLHERVTRVAILPVESYALKQIARWIGFNWRDGDANGAQAICWYEQWLLTGDRSQLEAIVRYNEDDCRATYYVKNWLADFSQVKQRRMKRRSTI
jgi:predicted RecB family nuclease